MGLRILIVLLSRGGIGAARNSRRQVSWPRLALGPFVLLAALRISGARAFQGSVTARSREGLTSSLPVGASSFSPSEGAIGPERGPKKTSGGEHASMVLGQ